MRKALAVLGVGILVFVGFAAVGPNPRYIEELVIGGGYNEPVDGGIDFEKDGDVLTNGKLTVGASATSRASLNLPHGTAPTSPVNGDLWSTTSGLYYRLDGATTGPLLTAATIPWDTPGPIGSTTPSSGSFTTGAFSGDITMTGSSTNFAANGSTAQLQFYHTKSSGNAWVRFQPVPQDGTGQATVDFFRSTNTSGYVGFLLRRGDGSSTAIFEVKAGSSPATYLRNSSGTSKLDVDHNTGNLTSSGDATVKGGDVVVGEANTTRGVVTAWDGSGGNAPGCIRIASPNGTSWYLFVEDDGTLKIHSALPTSNSNGAVVGLQF
jgi:hypothetical protein